MQQGQRLDESELTALTQDGFVVRRGVFSAAECVAIAADCEALVNAVAARRRGEKRRVGSYMFDVDDDALVVKWEPDAPELVQGLEHFDHVSPPALASIADDPRLLDPCKDLIGCDRVSLFTEKLNLKRARQGGVFVLHQDYPYWENFAHAADRIATAMIFLDDANSTNGCLEVAPGSHRSGKYRQREVEGFGGLEMDVDAFDTSRLVPLEGRAGDVAFFGPFLAHRSQPNRSDIDRRALLYSYQPAGLPHARALMRAAQGRQDVLSH